MAKFHIVHKNKKVGKGWQEICRRALAGMSRRFQEKYRATFDEFRKKVLDTEMGFEEEQDYFDWELAITGIGEMEREIRKRDDGR